MYNLEEAKHVTDNAGGRFRKSDSRANASPRFRDAPSAVDGQPTKPWMTPDLFSVPAITRTQLRLIEFNCLASNEPSNNT